MRGTFENLTYISEFLCQALQIFENGNHENHEYYGSCLECDIFHTASSFRWRNHAAVIRSYF